MIFTIAIPTYNSDDTLRYAVESCINQDFKHEYEVLVVNNNCTDNTQAILDEYRDNIRVYTNPVTVTTAGNHNVCLEKAKGDYIVYCHSDDKLLPDALSKFYSVLQKRVFPKKYVLWGRSMFRDYYINWRKTGVQLGQTCAGFDCFKAFFGGGLAPSGTCYSRQSFLEAGGFIDSDHRLSPIDMIVLWRLVLKDFKFEMSGNKFFIRERASTVVHLSTREWLASAIDAVKRFLNSINKSEQVLFINYVKTTRTNNFDTYMAFMKAGLVTRGFLIKNLAFHVADNPMDLFRPHYWKLLGRMIKW